MKPTIAMWMTVLVCLFLGQMSEAEDSHSAISTPDEFAWKLFAEINQPAKADAPDGLVVWESWILARSVFANPNQAPMWQSVPEVRSIDSLETRPLQQVIFEMQRSGKGNRIPEAIQVSSRAQRVDPGVIQRNGNETRMNREAFEFIVANDLYYIEGQERFFNSGKKIDFPVPAREIKAQWRRLDDPSLHSRYHTAQVDNNGKVEIWGLTALHITTKDLPNWFWATFEHKDNEGIEGVVPSRDAFGVAATGGQSTALQQLFRDSNLGSKWQNYVLRGTQVDFVDSIGRPTILGNSQIERGFQSTSSCISCHARASIGPKPDQEFDTENPQNPNDVSRLAVFESTEPLSGAVGVPKAEWFIDTKTTPIARKFTQLDFVWSMFRARRRQPFPGPVAVVPPLPAVGAVEQKSMKKPLIELRAAGYDANTRVGVEFGRNMRALRAKGSKFIVTYNGFSPEAQTAFQAAVNVWESLLQSDEPIRVTANWIPLGPGVLGSAGPATYIRDAAGAKSPNTWYPIALANKLAGTDLATSEVDIQCNFSSDFSNWYFGTDGNTPADQYDLMSVVLHELGHGLGFTGSMTVSGQTTGNWGGGTPWPMIYDRFGVNGSGQQLVDTSLFPNPSTLLGRQLSSANLFFSGPTAKTANGGSFPRLYAPNPFDPGSSFAHFDEAAYPAGNRDSLMTPQIGTNEAIHSPGPVGMAVLQDLGWTFTTSMLNDSTNVLSCCPSPGVELRDLRMRDEEQVRLVNAALETTKATFNQDDPQFYTHLNQTLMQIKNKQSITLPFEQNDSRDLQVFRPLRMRTISTIPDSVTNDPTWRANFIRWLSVPRQDRLRIWGGAPVSAGDFEHCVAVGNGGRFCCTGTLVSPRVVVTAAHCFHLGCIGNRGEVYFGLNSNNPSSGRVVSCKCIPHPQYNLSTNDNDIAVLILDEPVTNITPCAIASPKQIDEAFFLRLVGFGLTETGVAGNKMTVEVVVASNDCLLPKQQSTYGCKSGREIVAGGNGLDSCRGDSGGPAYIDIGGQFLLAGATSRAAANAAQSCGDGGIYVRIDKEWEWIESVLKAEGLSIETQTAKETHRDSDTQSKSKE